MNYTITVPHIQLKKKKNQDAFLGLDDPQHRRKHSDFSKSKYVNK